MKTIDQIQPDHLHVLQVVGDPVGGIRKHVHTIINDLHRFHSSLELSYAYSSTNTDERFKSDIENLRTKLTGEVQLTVKKKPHSSDIKNIILLMRFVKRTNVDIVHGHGAKGGLYARVLSILCGVKSIYTPHGGVVHKMFNPFADQLYSLVEKSLLSYTDYIVFESRYTACNYRDKCGRLPDNWEVNYNGLEYKDIIAVVEKSQKLAIMVSNVTNIGVFGMLRKEKGQIFALKAVHELVERGFKIKLHIFGNGPDRELLQSKTKELGIDNEVIFYPDTAEVDLFMAAMDIVVIPSLFDAFPYVALEALSMGKHVIASNVGGIPEIFSHYNNGQLVPPGNSELLTDAIVNYMMSDKNKTIECKVASEFTIDKMLTNLVKVYSSAMKDSQAASK